MTREPSSAPLPYRLSAGMMLLNSDGRIFVGRRIDQTVEAWQMPQGGIDKGEDPRKAALRELEEEIGTRNVSILRECPDWFTYDLPEHLVGVAMQGKYRGQKQKWFAMRFEGADSEIDLATSHPEFSEWKWATADDVVAMIVPFKRDVYSKIIAAFADLLPTKKS